METMGSGEAKTHLPRLLDRVAQGEAITITRQGVPIARLVPIEEQPKPEIQQVIEEIVAFRKQHPLNGLPLEE
jgi:prevent-host-death family protein